MTDRVKMGLVPWRSRRSSLRTCVSLLVINRGQAALSSVLRTRNVALWYVVGGALIFLTGALYIPILRDIFRFAPLPIGWIIASVAVGMSSLGTV